MIDIGDISDRFILHEENKMIKVLTKLFLGSTVIFVMGFVTSQSAYAIQGTLLWQDAMPPISPESPLLYWYFSGHGGTLKGVYTGGGSPPASINVTVTSYNGLTPLDNIPLTLVRVSGTNDYYLSPNAYINFVTTTGDDSLLKLQVMNGNKVKAEATDWVFAEVWIVNPEFRSIPGYVLAKQPNYTTKLCTAGPDVDNDGVCDAWEPAGGPLSITLNGITYTQSCLYSGSITQCMGSDNKDVFVEIDWYKEHGPDLNALNDIKIAFEQNGIRLHFLVDEEVLYHSVSDSGPDQNADLTDFTKVKKAQFGTYNERNTGTDANVKDRLTAKRQVFHYALLTHNYTSSPSPSGRAEIDTGGTNAANDLRTSLGGWAGGVGTRAEQAATLMHELGHNLGLNHGGSASNTTNCKPNYLSIMSYTFQFAVADINRPLDYSTTALDSLNEVASGQSLHEGNGITGTYNYADGTPRKIFYGDYNGNPQQDFVGSSINYDYPTEADTTDNDLSQDINDIPAWGCSADGLTNLTSYVDWSNLKYKMINSGSFADGYGQYNEEENAMPITNYDTYYFMILIAVLVVIVILIVIILMDSRALKRILGIE